MSFLSDLSHKLGFTSGDDDRADELEDRELPEDEEEEDYPEEDEERGAFRIPNPFRRSQPRSRVVEESDDEDTVPVQNTGRGNIIHDPRMESRNAQGSQASSSYTHRERIIDVRQIDDCRHIIRYLLEGESVLLNLENIEPKDCTRVVDLLSGAAFALQGRLVKIAHLSYLLTPQNVEVIEANPSAAERARYR